MTRTEAVTRVLAAVADVAKAAAERAEAGRGQGQALVVAANSSANTDSPGKATREGIGSGGPGMTRRGRIGAEWKALRRIQGASTGT